MSIPLVPLENIPFLPMDEFARTVTVRLRSGGRAAVFFAMPEAGAFRLVMAIAFDLEGRLELISAAAAGSFPSLTPELPQLHLFEREIYELTGLKPEGHPWLKPVRFTGAAARPGVAEFFRVHGSEVHEVAVGPDRKSVV